MDHYLFLLKKFLGNLLMPVPLMIVLLFWAFLLLLRRKTRWLGTVVVLLVTLILFCAGYPPLSNRYLAPLEAKIPTYQYNPEAPIDYVAVLGAWHQSSATLPVTSQIQPSGIIRLAEGIRIYRLNPGSKLIFTGFRGLPADPLSYPRKLRELALALGVPEEDMLLHEGPRDTAEEARLIAATYPEKTLALVTSAPHMPRALGLFRAAGLDPVPAPTNHQGKTFTSWWVFPSANCLARSEYWAHEGLGYLWARLTGQLKADD